MSKRKLVFGGKRTTAHVILAFVLFLTSGATGLAGTPMRRLPRVTTGSSPSDVASRDQLSHLLQSSDPVELPMIGDDFLSGRTTTATCWQFLPAGLIYRSYLAGVKEPHVATKWLHDKNEGWFWDATLGARLGLVRHGTTDPIRPDGWQLDVEGVSQLRLDPEEDLDVTAVDFRVGIPLTYGQGPYRMKLAWYHLSSHLGDEFMLKNPGVTRINYSRDAFVWGHSFYPTDDLRLYAEAEWAYYNDGGSRPWEFQFGIDYYHYAMAAHQLVPFVAINGHLREAVDFGGNLSVQAGLLRQGPSGQLFRIGLHYYVGKSDQYEFFDRYEDKVGLGVWYDF